MKKPYKPMNPWLEMFLIFIIGSSIAFGILLCILSLIANLNPAITQETPHEPSIEHLVEMTSENKNKNDSSSILDTSAIEEWCGEFSNGKVRMIGATPVKGTAKDWYLQDDAGNEWVVTGISLSRYDFLLLWIADNNTVDVTDDIIVKVWREA